MVRRSGDVFRVGSLLAIGIFFVSIWALARFSRVAFETLHHAFSGKPRDPALFNSLSLGESQCNALFPGLTEEIDTAVARGPFDLKLGPEDYRGLVQGKIADGKLYIVTANRRQDLSEQMLYERSGTLHQLYRAIVTSPSPLPITYFALCIIDTPRNNSWNFSRPKKHDPSVAFNHWIMPLFGHWSWPLSEIGTFEKVLQRITQVEVETPWAKKIPRAVWRGTTHFNPLGNPRLRPNLLAAARGKPWADVESLSSEQPLRIEDFCKYKYIIYTEGITYSGRLPYHQACASVILTPSPHYLQQSSHLLRPLIFSDPSKSKDRTTQQYSSAYKYYPAISANAIFLNADWSDLEAAISYLESNPAIAEAIAKRQRALAVESGYLSPAAMSCYWRALIRGWSSVARIRGEEEWAGGLRWETFQLTQKMDH